jgi:hypothetical protein
MASFRVRRAVLAVVLLGGTLLVGAALAGQVLTHKQAASSVIRACVKKEGELRIVDEASDCKKNESPLVWNVTGPQGAPGVSVTTVQLPAGDAHCAAGGLQVNAASGVTYVCNGAAGTNGADGRNGADGKDGKDGVSVTTTSLAVGDATCPTGGVRISAASGDTYVCNGAKGDTGAQGAPGSSTATLSSPNGVFKVEITDQGIFLRGPTKTLFLNRYSSGVGPTTSR